MLRERLDAPAVPSSPDMIDTIQVLATAAAPVAEAVAETDGTNALTEIFKEFHVTGWNFISQCVAFLIVAFALKTFAFGPVQAILEKRRQRIAEGEENLRKVEAQISENETRREEILTKANNDAKRLIEEAKESAAAVGEHKTQEAIAEAQKIIAKAREAAKAEHDEMRTGLRKEFGRLVVATTTQVTGKVLDADDQSRINEEALAKVS